MKARGWACGPTKCSPEHVAVFFSSCALIAWFGLSLSCDWDASGGVGEMSKKILQTAGMNRCSSSNSF